MSVTAEQVERAIASDRGYYWYGDLEWDIKRGRMSTLTIDGTALPVEFVEEKDGGEGDYETDVYVIFKVGDQYFRKAGYYASHVGTEWDGPLREVIRRKKVVKVWENK